jgi:hypothetical protein
MDHRGDRGVRRGGIDLRISAISAPSAVNDSVLLRRIPHVKLSEFGIAAETTKFAEANLFSYLGDLGVLGG